MRTFLEEVNKLPSTEIGKIYDIFSEPAKHKKFIFSVRNVSKTTFNEMVFLSSYFALENGELFFEFDRFKELYASYNYYYWRVINPATENRFRAIVKAKLAVPNKDSDELLSYLRGRLYELSEYIDKLNDPELRSLAASYFKDFSSRL